MASFNDMSRPVGTTLDEEKMRRCTIMRCCCVDVSKCRDSARDMSCMNMNTFKRWSTTKCFADVVAAHDAHLCSCLPLCMAYEYDVHVPVHTS
jgi:hypothetical protein